MQFDRFMVISWSEEDGLFVDHFPNREKARSFARQVADEGFRAQVTEERDFYEAVIEEDDHGGVRPGKDFPATLGRPVVYVPVRSRTLPPPASLPVGRTVGHDGCRPFSDFGKIRAENA